MRKVIVSAMTSVDGVMQAPGGPEEDPTGGFKHGGWVAPHFNEELGGIIVEMFSQPFELLLGRKTYEIFAAYWPYVAADDPIGGPFNQVTKYVATRNPDFKLNWRNSETLGDDAIEAVRKLKTEDGPPLLTQGSCNFIQSLFASDLVDELTITVFPLLLGKGKRLFAGGAVPARLKLISTRTTGSGVVVSKYVRNGEVETGSFAPQNPSEAELERRRNLT